jgi:hypothetical protein
MENAESSGNGNNQQFTPISASSPFSFEVWANYNPATEAERKAERTKAKQVAKAASEASPSATPMPDSRQSRHPLASPALPTPRPVPPAVASPMPMGNRNNLRPVYTPAPDQLGHRNGRVPNPNPNAGGTPQ